MLINVNLKEFAGIEEARLDEDNFIEMGFKWTTTPDERYREYIAQGRLKGEWFGEHFFNTEAKGLAYEYYTEKLNKIIQG